MLIDFSKNPNSRLEIKLNTYLNWDSNNLNFKNAQILDVTSYWSPSIYKNIWVFIKNALLFNLEQNLQKKKKTETEKEKK